MRDVSTIIREHQLAIRRELDRRRVSLKAVAFDSGIPYATLLSYFPGGEREPAEIPGGAIYSLHGVIPADLLNLLLPAGFAVVRIPDETDFDALADDFAEFLRAKNDCHHPGSEAGRDIGPTEHAKLSAKVVSITGAAAA